MLKLTNVDSYYDRSHILHAVCLDIPIGKVTAVLGRNGTGKTTLLKDIDGSYRPDGRPDQPRRSRDRKASDLPPPAPALPTFPRAARSFRISPSAKYPDGRFRRGADGQAPEVPELVPELFPLPDGQSRTVPAAFSPAGSSSSLRSRARWPPIRRSSCSMSPNEGIQPSIVEEIEAVIIRLNREVA